jgi:hypothetical protein
MSNTQANRTTTLTVGLTAEVFMNEKVDNLLSFPIEMKTDFSRLWLWNSWGLLFNLLNEGGYKGMNFWGVPFSSFAYSTDWGDHYLLDFPEAFLNETFGYTLGNIDLLGPRIIETILKGKGIKKLRFEFLKYKSKKTSFEITDDSEMYTVPIDFYPIWQGVSTHSPVEPGRLFYKTVFVEEGFEKFWIRSGGGFQTEEGGEFLTEVNKQLGKQSTSKLEKKSAFFTNKHLRHHVIEWTLMKEFFDTQKLKLAGKYATLSESDKSIWDNFDDFSVKERDMRGLFYFQTPPNFGVRPEEDGKENATLLDFPLRTVDLKTFPDENLLVPVQEQMPVSESPYFSKIFDLRLSSFFLTKEQEEEMTLITLRVAPDFAHFLGTGMVTPVMLLPIYKTPIRLLILSWAYVTYKVGSEVHAEVELIGLKLKDKQIETNIG